MKKLLLVTLAGAALIVPGAFAQGTLDVNGSAAYAGNFGLETSVGAADDKAYVQDDTPADEKVYSASFWLNPNSMTFPQGNAHYIFQALSTNPWGGGNVKAFEVELRRRQGSTFRIRALAFYDKEVDPKRLATGLIALAPDAWNRVQLEWTAAANNTTPDSILRISVVDGPQSGASAELVNKLKNQKHGINIVRLGVVRGTDGTTSGSHFFDDFVSFRSLAP